MIHVTEKDICVTGAYNKGGRSFGRSNMRSRWKKRSLPTDCVLNACVGAKIAVKEGEEAIDVCLAIQQMNEEAAQKAAQKERISTLFANIKNLMEKMGWSAEQSMDVLSVSDSDRKALWQLLR